jgi:hypothetical protein
MSMPVRLTIVLTLFLALFALWRAQVEYANYSTVLSTIPLHADDPLVVYEIGRLETATAAVTSTPLATHTATPAGIQTVFRPTTATVAALPSKVPSFTPLPASTATPAPTLTPSPRPPDEEADEFYLTLDTLSANWDDRITVSWNVPDTTTSTAIHYWNEHLGYTLLSGTKGGWLDLAGEGSRTVPIMELLGTQCQSRFLVLELEAYQPDGERLTERVTATIAYPGVPLALTSISVSPNPAPAYRSVTLTWEGQGGANMNWIGNSGIDDFGVDAAKHWRELRLSGASGTISWLLNRHALTNTYQYSYGTPRLPAICDTIDLQMTCPHTYWYDEPEQRTEASCPTSAPVTIPGAYQTFEQGVMVWDSDLKMIHILYHDGTSERHPDYWNGEPITYPETPPPGLLLPQQGFGYLWSNADFIPERLGWATAPEQGYMMTLQQVKNEIGGYLSNYEIRGPIYFSLPDGRVVRSFGAWQYMD